MTVIAADVDCAAREQISLILDPMSGCVTIKVFGTGFDGVATTAQTTMTAYGFERLMQSMMSIQAFRESFAHLLV